MLLLHCKARLPSVLAVGVRAPWRSHTPATLLGGRNDRRGCLRLPGCGGGIAFVARRERQTRGRIDGSLLERRVLRASPCWAEAIWGDGCCRARLRRERQARPGLQGSLLERGLRRSPPEAASLSTTAAPLPRAALPPAALLSAMAALLLRVMPPSPPRRRHSRRWRLCCHAPRINPDGIARNSGGCAAARRAALNCGTLIAAPLPPALGIAG